MSLHPFAGLRVRDFQAARPLYERLLGQPTFFPDATEAVWTLAERRSAYVVERADGAGNSAVTIFVDDLDAHVAAIAARGLEPDERETYSNGVRKVLYRDPTATSWSRGRAARHRFTGLKAEADGMPAGISCSPNPGIPSEQARCNNDQIEARRKSPTTAASRLLLLSAQAARSGVPALTSSSITSQALGRHRPPVASAASPRDAKARTARLLEAQPRRRNSGHVG